MIRHVFVFASIFFVVLSMADADAHRPFWAENNHTNLETAFVVEDPTESMVLNHEATCQNLDVWLSFQAEAGDEIFIQAGVPNISRLRSYAISTAVAGPGIDGSIPLDTNGIGAVLLPELAEPKFFVDRESQTESNVYFEQTFKAPATGTFYLIGWPTEWQTGKLWLTVGTEERFTELDFPFFPEWIRRMKEFYEVDSETEEPVDTGKQVEQCEPDESFTGEAGGCSVGFGSGGIPTWPAMLAVVFGLVAIRRRVVRE